MKIISKYKDYYDYYQGIYGIDEKIVYDRRHDGFTKPLNGYDGTPNEYRFAICGKGYTLYYFNGKIYHTVDEIKVLLKKAKNFGYSFPYYRRMRDSYLKQVWKTNNPEKVDANLRLREPVLIQSTIGYSNGFHSTESEWEHAILKDFDFAKIIPADQMFIDISNFLSWLVDNPPLPNKQTNKEKIVSHGFDLKKSFRHRKE